jgi:hypothetical protein
MARAEEPRWLEIPGGSITGLPVMNEAAGAADAAAWVMSAVLIFGSDKLWGHKEVFL